MSSDESSTPWVFEEGELPRWAAPRIVKTTPAFDFGIGTPAVMPEPIWPLFGRIMLVRLGVVLAFPAIVLLGAHFSATTSVAQMLVNYCLAGFLVGAIIYFWLMKHRYDAQTMGPLHPSQLPASPSVWALFAPPIILPLALLTARLFFVAFADRFVGVALASLACLAVFHRFGDRPIGFMQELLLADLSVTPGERRTRNRFSGQPELLKLAIVLLVALLVPAVMSNAWGILAVLVLCGMEFRRTVLPLLRFGAWQTVIAALWVRARKVVAESFDYAPLDQNHWHPPESLVKRRWGLVALLVSFDLALLTSLAYYVPWEPFAALFVPNFKANFLLVSDYALNDYRWLIAPFKLTEQAQPEEGYMFCFVIAIFLHFFLPAMVLFLLYVERLAQLEILAQDLKRAKR